MKKAIIKAITNLVSKKKLLNLLHFASNSGGGGEGRWCFGDQVGKNNFVLPSAYCKPGMPQTYLECRHDPTQDRWKSKIATSCH